MRTDSSVLGSVAAARLDERGEAAFAWVDAEGRRHEGFVVAVDGAYRAYVNHCPHWGVPLAPLRGPFLEEETGLVRCRSHGARFRREDGRCVDGPCPGASLTALVAERVGDDVVVSWPRSVLRRDRVTTMRLPAVLPPEKP